jgi:VanZ family protein
MRTRALCIVVAALLVASLFVSAPSTGGMIRPPWDKLAHFAFYGSIAFLIAMGLGSGRLLLAFSLTCLVGIADEAYQSTLPGRFAEAADLLADFAAAAAAVFTVKWFMEGKRPAG